MRTIPKPFEKLWCDRKRETLLAVDELSGSTARDVLKILLERTPTNSAGNTTNPFAYQYKVDFDKVVDQILDEGGKG